MVILTIQSKKNVINTKKKLKNKQTKQAKNNINNNVMTILWEMNNNKQTEMEPHEKLLKYTDH